jgi:hypothetical protein
MTRMREREREKERERERERDCRSLKKRVGGEQQQQKSLLTPQFSYSELRRERWYSGCLAMDHYYGKQALITRSELWDSSKVTDESFIKLAQTIEAHENIQAGQSPLNVMREK